MRLPEGFPVVQTGHEPSACAPADLLKKLPVGGGDDPAPPVMAAAQPAPRKPVVDAAAAEAAQGGDFQRRIKESVRRDRSSHKGVLLDKRAMLVIQCGEGEEASREAK